MTLLNFKQGCFMSICEVFWIKTHEIVFYVFVFWLNFRLYLVYFTLYCFYRSVCGLCFLYCFWFFAFFFFDYQEFSYLFPTLVTKNRHCKLKFGEFCVCPSSNTVVSTFWRIVVNVGIINFTFIWIGQWSLVVLPIFDYFLQFKLFSSFDGF